MSPTFIRAAPSIGRVIDRVIDVDLNSGPASITGGLGNSPLDLALPHSVHLVTPKEGFGNRSSPARGRGPDERTADTTLPALANPSPLERRLPKDVFRWKRKRR